MRTAQWAQKDGTKIRICDMADSHLINTIKMLDRKHAQICAETSYPISNGEMAQLQLDRDFDSLMESDPGYLWSVYDDLVAEARDRDLKR